MIKQACNFRNFAPGLALRLAILLAITGTCTAAPQFNRIEPLPSHSDAGLDPFASSTETRHKGSWMSSTRITPFFQDALGARDSNGNDIPIGAEFGPWNTAGIFYGLEQGTESSPVANPKEYTFTANSLPGTTWTQATDATLTSQGYPKIKQTLQEGLGTLTKFLDPDDADFDPTLAISGFDTIEMEYKRYGVRGEIRVSPFDGGHLIVKSGACEYRMAPTTLAPARGTTAPDSDQTTLERYLQNPHNRAEIMEEMGLSIDPVREIAFEDTYVQLAGSYPITMKDYNGHGGVNFSPMLAIGVWLPSGKKKDHSKAFSIPTGNDGHTGLCIEGALNLDFLDTAAFSVGGGGTVFNDQTYDVFRVPNHRLQNGFYPWTTKVKRKPGYSWFGHLSMRSVRFISGTTFTFDYSYSGHKQDELTCEDSDTARAALFKDGLKLLAERSEWSSHDIHAGFTYEASQNIELGGAVHTSVDGTMTFRTNTLMGVVRFLF